MFEINLGQGIALASLVVAALVGLLAARRDRINSPRLRLKGEYLPRSGEGIAFLLTFRNEGRHPVSIEGIWLETTRGETVSFDLPILPFEVVDIRPVRLQFPLSSALHRGTLLSPMEVEYIAAKDTIGKVYRIPRHRWNRRAFVRSIRSQWTDEDRAYWEERRKEYQAKSRKK